MELLYFFEGIGITKYQNKVFGTHKEKTQLYTDCHIFCYTGLTLIMVFVFFSTYKVFSHHSFPQKLVPFWKGTTSWAEGNNFPHSDDNITFHFESACHLSLCMSSEKSVLPTLPLLCVMKIFLQLGFKCQIYQSCKLNELSTKVMKIAN